MFKSHPLLLAFMTAFTVLIGTASAAYYFLGVSPLDTAGISRLNQNITRMKALLSASQMTNSQLTTDLNTAQATITSDQATMTQLTTNNSVLATAVATRYRLIAAIATALKDRKSVV